jgi:hypothetical protein
VTGLNPKESVSTSPYCSFTNNSDRVSEKTLSSLASLKSGRLTSASIPEGLNLPSDENASMRPPSSSFYRVSEKTPLWARLR